MIQVSDYTRMVDEFVQAMSGLGDDVCSVILYGSIVKNTVRPGVSDLIDAVVIFQPGVLQDETACYRALDVMTDISTRLANRGIPFHPCHYFTLDFWSALAQYVPSWESERFSRIAAGRDVRPFLRSADLDFAYVRGLYFASCTQFRRSAALFMSKLHSSQGPLKIGPFLRNFIRDLPIPCFACNRPIERADSLLQVVQLFPHELDIRMLQELWERIENAPAHLEHDEALFLLEKCIELNETLYHLVVRWLKLHGESHLVHEDYIKLASDTPPSG
jgi:hypothetical protein